MGGDVAVSTPRFASSAKGVCSLTRRSEVRFRGHSGKHLLGLSITGFDPSLPFDDQFCCGAQQGSHATVW
jgi:hypothetical protein